MQTTKEKLDFLLSLRDETKKIVETQTNKLQGLESQITDLQNTLDSEEQGAFEGPYTLERKPRPGQRCAIIYLCPRTKKLEVRLEPYAEKTTLDHLKLILGWIYPNNRGGWYNAEQKIKDNLALVNHSPTPKT